MQEKFFKCFIKGSGGENCPETPRYVLKINGTRQYVCNKCYNNIKNGAYGSIRFNLVQILP
jgi:ribosomal protein L37AE/L43A